MPLHRDDRIGLLVVRTFVVIGGRRRLIVQLLEVNPHSPDQVIGTVGSPAAAARVVGQWLGSLMDVEPTSGGAEHQRADRDR